MAGFGRFQDNLDGFAVAHLPHQNHLGRLPQRRAQGMSEAGRVTVQFTLMDGGALVVVQELDGIFDGDDVVVLLAIDAVKKHGQSGGLAGSGRSGDEHDAIAQLGHIRRDARADRARRKSGMKVEITRITTAQLPR